MDSTTSWSLVVGVLFVVASLLRGVLKSLPLSAPAIYLLIGGCLGSWGLGIIQIDLIEDAKLIEALTEIGVLISLLTAGLMLQPSLKMMLGAPLLLATITMVGTIALLTGLGYWGLGLPLGAAVLLGAILAPTDPVLASELQVDHQQDRDQLRYSLTGEAGLNDGMAFPFIMLGLGLLDLHDLGSWGWRWWIIDLVWAVGAGLVSGWVLGYAVGWTAVRLRRRGKTAVACEELLTLGVIGISYGVALLIGAYGFLAVFAAGVAIRHYSTVDLRDEQAVKLKDEVITINGQFEQIAEIALVVLAGALLAKHGAGYADWWIPAVLFFVFRPAATTVALLGTKVSRFQRLLIAFFGVRGIGSMYYLSHAIAEGLPEDEALRIGGIVLTTVAFSVLVHSNPASLLLNYYRGAKS